MCADSHEMSAPPLEWADWSAQSLRIIFSALTSSKLLMQYAVLLSSPPSSALSKHIISSLIEMTFSTLLRLRSKETQFRLDAEFLGVPADRRSSAIARLVTAVVL